MTPIEMGVGMSPRVVEVAEGVLYTLPEASRSLIDGVIDAQARRLEAATQRIKDLEAIEHKLNGKIEALQREYAGCDNARAPARAVGDSRTMTELRSQIDALEGEIVARAYNQAELRGRIIQLLHELEGPRSDR